MERRQCRVCPQVTTKEWMTMRGFKSLIGAALILLQGLSRLIKDFKIVAKGA